MIEEIYACVCSTGTRVRVVFSPLHPLLPYISIPRSVDVGATAIGVSQCP